MTFDIKYIFSQFDIDGTFKSVSEIHSGHINDTFLIETAQKPFYILQRVNHQVFQDVPRLMNNKTSISSHLKAKLGHLSKTELYKRVLTFALTKSGKSYYRDTYGNYWNLMFYVDDCISYLSVTDPKIAFEAGRIFGEFLSLTSDFDSSTLFEVIPNFHTMSFRFTKFDETFINASTKRKLQAAKSVKFVNGLRNEMHKIEELIKDGRIPVRVTHNDTKVSNALFSKDGKALCVIDTDTVMEGVVHFDFGDAIRIICNTTDEDESDLSKVHFDLLYFEAFSKGFIGLIGREVSEIEVEYLAFSAKMMTFIVGLRMLTDFLNDDVYFKTKYETHNLDRAKNQFKLVSEIEKQMEKMDEIVKREYKIALRD